MREYGELPFKLMMDREVLSRSVSELLSLDPDDGAEGTIVRANQLRAKLKFVAKLADEWVACGGLGCLSSSPYPERLQWKGIDLENGRKKDSITLGRFGGDDHALRVSDE